MSLAARLATYVVKFAMTPLSLTILGDEQFGTWLAIGSLVAWMGIADLGISSSLVPIVAFETGADSVSAVQRHVSTAFSLLAAITIILILVGALLLNISSSAALSTLVGLKAPRTDIGSIIFASGMTFIISMHCHYISSIGSGLQRGYVAAGAQISSQVCSIFVLLLLWHWRADLQTYALGMCGPAVINAMLLWGYFFLIRYPHLRPRWRFCSASSIKALISFSVPMTVIQLATTSLSYSAPLLIALTLTSKAVTQFAIPYSLILVCSNVCAAFSDPYVSTLTESTARADWDWARTAILRIIRRTAMNALILGVLFLVSGRFLINTWVGPDYVPPRSMVLAMAVYFLGVVGSNTMGTILIGLGQPGRRAVLLVVASTVFTGVSWLLLPAWGIISIPVAGIFAYSVEMLAGATLCHKLVHATGVAPSRGITGSPLES